jgi:hypothetical protein
MTLTDSYTRSRLAAPIVGWCATRPRGAARRGRSTGAARRGLGAGRAR